MMDIYIGRHTCLHMYILGKGPPKHGRVAVASWGWQCVKAPPHRITTKLLFLLSSFPFKPIYLFFLFFSLPSLTMVDAPFALPMMPRLLTTLCNFINICDLLPQNECKVASLYTRDIACWTYHRTIENKGKSTQNIDFYWTKQEAIPTYHISFNTLHCEEFESVIILNSSCCYFMLIL